jgi:hypothetical protein
MTGCDKPDNNSLFTKILRAMNYYHGPECDYSELYKKYYDIFLKSFAFLKLFSIFFFLLIIGLCNLAINKEESIYYMKNNSLKFFLELLLLFAAFFIPTIIMHITRGKTNLLNVKSLFFTAVFLFVFVCFKHVTLELSGLYTLKFGNPQCKKEHFESSSKETEYNKCKCLNGIFTGPFWKGAGYYGIGLTFILLLFFGFSLVSPDWTKNFFNYEFNQLMSLMYIIIGILIPFVIGMFMDENPLNSFTGMKECRDKDEDKGWFKNKFEKIRNGCALVSMTFMTVITFILPVVIIQWITDKSLNSQNAKVPPFSNYDCKMQNIMKNPTLRFGIILIESILIYGVFVLAEAGIEHLRKDIDYIEILKSKHFWMNSILTFLGILCFQILLEYSSWFEKHLFNDDKANKQNCSKD